MSKKTILVFVIALLTNIGTTNAFKKITYLGQKSRPLSTTLKAHNTSLASLGVSAIGNALRQIGKSTKNTAVRLGATVLGESLKSIGETLKPLSHYHSFATTTHSL